jgi:hypothetical protein
MLSVLFFGKGGNVLHGMCHPEPIFEGPNIGHLKRPSKFVRMCRLEEKRVVNVSRPVRYNVAEIGGNKIVLGGLEEQFRSEKVKSELNRHQAEIERFEGGRGTKKAETERLEGWLEQIKKRTLQDAKQEIDDEVSAQFRTANPATQMAWQSYLQQVLKRFAHSKTWGDRIGKLVITVICLHRNRTMKREFGISFGGSMAVMVIKTKTRF